MGNQNDEYQRFKLLKSIGDLRIFYDSASQSVPYVVIKNKDRWPETTADLMNGGAVLFSSKKLVKEYLIRQMKEKNNESGTNEFE